MISVSFPFCEKNYLIQSTPFIESHLLDKLYPFCISGNNDSEWGLLLSTKENTIVIQNKFGRIINTKMFANEKELFNSLISLIRDNSIARNNYCLLHASLIKWNNSGILLIGESGSGKTTLSAFLNTKKRIDCCADDIVAIDSTANATGMSKYLFLRKDCIQLHIISSDNLFYDNFFDRYLIPIKPRSIKISRSYVLCRENIVEPFERAISNPIESYLKNMYFPFSIKSNLTVALNLSEIVKTTELHYNDLDNVYDYLQLSIQDS